MITSASGTRDIKTERNTNLELCFRALIDVHKVSQVLS